MSQFPEYDVPPPRSSSSCPPALHRAVTSGTLFNVGIFAALLYGAYWIRSEHIWGERHFLTSAPLAMALVAFVLAVLYAIHKHIFAAALWRNGTLRSGEVTGITKEITRHVKNGILRGSTEHYRIDLRFEDTHQRPWVVTFDTEEAALLESSQPPAGPFEVLVLPGRSAPGRAVVLEARDRLHDCVVRKPGRGPMLRWLVLGPILILVLAAAAAAGVRLNERQLQQSYQAARDEEESRVVEQETRDWADRAKKAPLQASEPLSESRGTRNRLLRVHYPPSFTLRDIESSGRTRHIYPKTTVHLTRSVADRQVQKLYYTSIESPRYKDLAELEKSMHRTFLFKSPSEDLQGRSEMSTCAGLPALVHRGVETYLGIEITHVTCSIFHQGHGFFLSYQTPSSRVAEDGPMLEAMLDSAELY